MAVTLKIKWNKEEFDVEVEEGSTVEVFKTQVWTLTSVPVERQKLIGFPGGMLKDSDDFMAKVKKLKPGAKIQLIGTAEGGELKEPAEKTVFEEDLTPDERRRVLKEKKVEVLPAGIKNLGNTCYMNSTVQCLASLQGLMGAVNGFSAGGDRAERGIDGVLTTQFKAMASNLQHSAEAIVPLQFVMALRQRFPKFAEMQNGGYMQQDADECLRGLLQVFANTCVAGDGNRIDDLFGVKMQSSMKCLECDEEPVQTSETLERVLICHLGTQTEPVSHIHQGVSLSMKEHIEKNSAVLGRNAQYEKSSALASCPQYLVVQFARFGFKGANDWAGTSAAKVKLIRKCAFSPSFDAFDLATDELKKKLQVGRLKKKEQEDKELEREKEALGKKSLGSTAPADEDEDGDVDMTPAAGLEEFDTGYYELVGIVSHKGRTADGGHYVGWTRTKKAKRNQHMEDRWCCFDDEDTSMHAFKDMLAPTGIDLQGGKADTQIAYINIYKKVSVWDTGNVLGSKDEDVTMGTATDDAAAAGYAAGSAPPTAEAANAAAAAAPAPEPKPDA